MTNTDNPQDIYKQRIQTFEAEMRQLQERKTMLGAMRLVSGIAIISLVYYLFFNQAVLVWALVVVAIAIFLLLVSRDADNNAAIKKCRQLLEINNAEIRFLAFDFSGVETGEEYLPADHPYAADLDIFGDRSIFQLVSRCRSQQGKQLLADRLLQPGSKARILEWQEAAKVLSTEMNWRQVLMQLGEDTQVTKKAEQKLLDWLRMPTVFNEKNWRMLPNVFTLVSLSVVVLYVTGHIVAPVFSLLVFLFFLAGNVISGRINATYLALTKITDEVGTIAQMLSHVEGIPAGSVVTHNLSGYLEKDGAGSKAAFAIKSILNRFDVRLNVFVFIILNTFVLWDLRQLNQLNGWKRKYGKALPKWFEIIAEADVLNSIATLTFNQQDWIFPALTDEYFTLKAIECGHPMIKAASRVNNSFEMSGMGKVSVITGSNMAGKSTFLRSLGVNLVLAQLGAPVCARRFQFSITQLYSSMRIADNLAENTSTFYAELKKLKAIIEQVRQHQPVFILLDEILRGTNSLDRHTGSVALLRQLIREDAVGVIATHDVELAALQKDYSTAIENYHFDVQVAGEELYFDYKLKRGICTSMNASILMKKIGIEM